jgi:hypothetical protein
LSIRLINELSGIAFTKTQMGQTRKVTQKKMDLMKAWKTSQKRSMVINQCQVKVKMARSLRKIILASRCTFKARI